MQTGTLVLIILALLLALVLAWFQYGKLRANLGNTLSWILATLRFITISIILLLLINPQMIRNTYQESRQNLVLLRDNSSSLADSAAAEQLQHSYELITADREIQQRFNIHEFTFGTELSATDTLNFSESATNIHAALQGVIELFRKQETAVVLFSDGNQTLGTDYEFPPEKDRFPVYTVAVGDTTQYADVSVDQVNVNQFSFLNNQYPVEAFVSYSGDSPVRTTLTLLVDDVPVHRVNLDLDPSVNSYSYRHLLTADKVGFKNISFVLSALPNERNQVNNRRKVVLEVVDERTEIALISERMHPDLGALIKVIESNEQRSVSFLGPDTDPLLLEEKDLLILYQPTSRFNRLYEWMKNKNPNRMTISGPNTDWDFLNNAQDNFQKEVLDETENAVPILNPGFEKFDISDFEIRNYPPLDVNLGDILITKPHEVLLGQQIRGIEIEEPLLAVITNDQAREAVLFGEHIWKWRMQDYRNNNSFENFDQFFNKILRYLSDTASRERLSLDYKNLFEGNSRAMVRASFFDETYIFDTGAELSLRIRRSGEESYTEMPMLLKGSYFEADLSNLQAGDYEFTVAVRGYPNSKSGRFTILDYEVEDQLVSTNYKKLQRLSQRTGGGLYFPAQTDSLLRVLQEDPGLSPVLESKQNVVSLIEFAWLLAILALSLAAEWFIRKYNGLI
ncbi:VWA domain-containing protein [Zeaxanthinibacter enoshimensis]|uniref:VWA domain-containing protein n=1 Tax=Zeaxanthinibacter enoshimensis TaxID=392009 RepID=A0A4R6TNF6_9FLAO|nr:VWA domain-containing protein [Zeaxanthinibacter enoshimensis]TDQ31448.1 hypothetical protein CLV82_2156 [Zeaxanthinibacter enoshimensis]